MIGVYANCQFVTGNVFLDGIEPPGADQAGLSALIDSAIARKGFDESIAYASELLKRYGIDYLEVERKGYAGCEHPGTGRFVQAIGNYCGSRLASAEIWIDGKLYLKQSGEISSFEQFVEESVARLRNNNITDLPRIEVNSDGACDDMASREQR